MPKMCFLRPKDKKSGSRKYITDPFSKITYPVSPPSPHSSTSKHRASMVVNANHVSMNMNLSPMWSPPSNESMWEQYTYDQLQPSSVYAPSSIFISPPQHQPTFTAINQTQPRTHHATIYCGHPAPPPSHPPPSDLEKQIKEGFGKWDKRWEEQQQQNALAGAEKRGRESARLEHERKEERERWDRIERELDGRGRREMEGNDSGGGVHLKGPREMERDPVHVVHTVNLGGNGGGGLQIEGRGPSMNDRWVMEQLGGRLGRFEDNHYRCDGERERNRGGRSRSSCGECPCMRY
jgi:hypothetical protein